MPTSLTHRERALAHLESQAANFPAAPSAEKPPPEKTWLIRDGDGGNARRLTLAEFRAELDARHALARPIAQALRRGDLAGMARAQDAMRAALEAARKGAR